MYTSNIDIMFVCLTFFFANKFHRNSIQRHVRLAFCAFFIYLYLFFCYFFFNSHVRLRASNFYCCIVLTFHFFLFFYYCYCNKVFCVTTSHRYLHWATHMESSVNSDSEKSRFIRGICRQHCLSHVSFMATFAYISILNVLYVCVCVPVHFKFIKLFTTLSKWELNLNWNGNCN